MAGCGVSVFSDGSPTEYDERLARRCRIYGLTPAEFAEMERLQEGVCAICGKPEESRYSKHPLSFVVDHDHVPGWKHVPPEERRKFIRGLLHQSCNQDLGYLERKGWISPYDRDAKWERRARWYIDFPPARRALGLG